MSPISATARRSAAQTTHQQFLSDVVSGFGNQPRSIPCKWLYDARGSELFEQICSTDDYYVTRTEMGLLDRHAVDIARRVGPGVEILEPGAGSGEKASLLLTALARPAAYLPLDISPAATEQAVSVVGRAHPALAVEPRVGDFMRVSAEGVPRVTASSRRLLLFPGSTLGNFSTAERRPLLRQFRNWLAPGDLLLLGVDLVKDVAVLERAYDDAQGVTAAFNLNLLERMRRELGARVEPNRFRHRAIYNEREQRVEMHLVSCEDQLVTLDGHPYSFRRGEFIHTENSHKFLPVPLSREVEHAGFRLLQRWEDERAYFSLQLYVAA